MPYGVTISPFLFRSVSYYSDPIDQNLDFWIPLQHRTGQRWPLITYAGDPQVSGNTSNFVEASTTVSHHWDTWCANNGGYLPPARYVSRFGSDNNKLLWASLKKWKDEHTIYKSVPLRYFKKTRTFDLKKGKFVTKKVEIKTIRLIKSRPKFVKKSKLLLKRNSLFYFERVCRDVASLDCSYEGAWNEYHFIDISNDFQFLAGIWQVNHTGSSQCIWVKPPFNNHPFGGYHQMLDIHMNGTNGFNSYVPRDDHFWEVYSDTISNCEIKAQKRLFSKLMDQKLDLATDLAEISQTAKLIGDAAVALGKAFLDIKQGRIASALSQVIPKDRKSLANVFLAYRYGVAPLMSDIDGAAQFLAERIQGFRPLTVKAKQKAIIQTVDSVTYSSDPTAMGWINTVSKKVTVQVKYSLDFKISDQLLNDLSRLGFTSPANVAWELTPFSFIFDWFFPIGEYIKALSAMEGLELKSIWKTTSVKEEITYSTKFFDLELSGFGPYYGLSVVGFLASDGKTGLNFKSKVDNMSVTRVEIPLDLFGTKPPLPRFKNPISAGHIANAIALLQQMFGKK